jgi:ABC-type polysaccharide/polyol phosphate transport system ATPase subunit
MYSKLAFSITAILETQILLIDEVFSVGDIKFKQKSYNKMKELISQEDRTVVIVSHSMGALKELCDEVIWLNDGVIMGQGKPEEIIPQYEEYMHNLQ